MASKMAIKWNLVIFFLMLVMFYRSWNLVEKQNDKPIVILSSNFNYRYLFLLPFTVSSWKRIGVDSIIIFVGKKNEFLTNHQARETIKILEEMNATILFFQANRLSTSSFSQIIRLFGAVLPLSTLNIPDERIILTSDADLAVFNSSNHIPNLVDKKVVRLYNSECCGNITVPLIHGNFQVKMYPMGTIGATKKVWGEIMGFKRNRYFYEEDVERYVIAEFGDNFFHSTDDTLIGSSMWYADQSLFSYKFDQWVNKFSNKDLVSHHLHVPRRIDRIQWPTAKNFSQLNIENFDDTHLPISAYSKKEWEKFIPFIDFAFKDDELLIQKLKKYRESFCGFNAVEFKMIEC